MKQMLIIPKTPYLSLIGRFDLKSPEYAMLKNGIVDHTEHGEVVEIFCDDERVKSIVDLVARVAPDLLPSIKQVNLPPDL